MRSISAAAFVLALLGAAPAFANHAGWYTQMRQQREAASGQRESFDKPKRADSLSNKTQELPVRHLAGQSTYSMRGESPFARASRKSDAWDSRGLGLSLHASTVSTPHSIYARLNTAPVAIRQQLRVSVSSRPSTNVLSNVIRSAPVASSPFKIAFNDRRVEEPRASVFLAFKQ